VRKIIASEFVSLNGVMEAPEQWHFPFINFDLQAEINASIHAADALLFGRVTFEIFAKHWSSKTHNEHGIADQLNRVPKYVVSTTLEHTDWNNSSILKGNLKEEILRLKMQTGGDIGIIGSAKLVESLLQMDLIDEIRLWVHPVVVKGGQHLFSDQFDSKTMHLLESKTHETGVVSVLYQTAPLRALTPQL
jgi:dihydrofolate reductase